jgi:hypothetical protein
MASELPEVHIESLEDITASQVGEKLAVFISYPTENHKIAAGIEDALRTFDRDKFDVFLDRARIDEGGDLTSTIENALERADYFVGIGPAASRSNFSWCGMELGYFLASTKGKPRHITAIYNNEIPDLFRRYKNVQVISLEEKHRSELGPEVHNVEDSDLYSFFQRLSEEIGRRFPPASPARYFEDAQKWAEKSAKEITDSYFDTLQEGVKSTWFPQKRIEVRTDSFAFWEKGNPTIPAQAIVVLEATTCGVFKYGVSKEQTSVTKTWKEFEDLVLQQTGALNFTTMTADVIVSALPNNAEALNDHCFLAPDEKSYRILLVMHRLYGNGKREFVVNLVETLRPISGEGDKDTSVMTAAIMLASKYRFLFLEQESRYGTDRMAQATGGNSTIAVRQLIKDLDRVHAEASKEGFGDESALTKLFSPADEFEVRDLFGKFWPPLTAMKRAASDFIEKPSDQTRVLLTDAHKIFVDACRSINSRFITLCMARYQSFIED